MYPYFMFDSTFLILIPAMIFAAYAQAKVKTAFSKYLKVQTRKGYRGYDVARAILDKNGLRDVEVELVGGHLSDHYDPRSRKVRLSSEVYNGSSVASVSVAAHEVGHALQHANAYAPLKLRSAILPISSFGSRAAWLFVIVGIIMGAPNLTTLGILLFSAAVAFSVVTLPVEFNASSRAMRLLDEYGFITQEEYRPAKKVLNAAALTYVAATATAIAQLARLIMIKNRRSR